MHEMILEAGQKSRHYWRDLWRYRELFYFLAWRDILVRYKQTVIGIAWAVIRPLLTMVILTIVFGRLARLPSAGVPYPILVFSGMLPWHFFANAFAESSNSLVASANLVSKVYFPRLIVPAGSVITSIVDFSISACLLAAMMAIYRVPPSPMVFALPLFVVMALATSFGIGLWVSALMVRYRDFRFIVPFVVQFGLYLSPVGFTSLTAATKVLPEQWLILYWLNPMAGVIDGFRWAILGGENQIYFPGLYLSLGVIAVVLLTGLRHFRRAEQSFADVI